MGFRHGASHGEVIITNDGPCLVEMNFCCHGGDASWHSLCRALNNGSTQIEATADAYLDGEAFANLPDKPTSPFFAAGREVSLVLYSEGLVRATPSYDEIRKLDSFVGLEASVRPDSKVVRTIDLITAVGSVILMHPDQRTLDEDLKKIRRMERENRLFLFRKEGL